MILICIFLGAFALVAIPFILTVAFEALDVF